MELNVVPIRSLRFNQGSNQWRNCSVVSTHNYMPFGEEMAAASSSVNYMFTGQEKDETGLYNFRARMYDPSLGIFFGVDPAGQNFAPFSYCGNNPVIYTDPTGSIFGIDDAIFASMLFSAFNGITHAEYNNQTWYEGLAKGAVEGGLQVH